MQARADQGDASAMYLIGGMYDRGEGVPKDDKGAAYWWRKAAMLGDSDSQRRLDAMGVAAAPAPAAPTAAPANPLAFTVPLKEEGGTLVVPVQINNVITLDFIIDSGAADVSIPADVVLTLIRTGTVLDSDFLGDKIYVLADGSKVPSKTFRIRSLKVGGRTLENVVASVADIKGPLLLGQSFLSRFKSWSINNQNRVLVLDCGDHDGQAPHFYRKMGDLTPKPLSCVVERRRRQWGG